MFKDFIDFVRQLYNSNEEIPLHKPFFNGCEKKYLNECIDTTYVSSVGKFVYKFEEMVKEYTGSKYAVACINGTSALHLALLLSGVEYNDEVLTQAMTFVGGVNAIKYANANPVFIDIDKETLGMSPVKLENWLFSNTEIKNNECYNIYSKKRIKACIPMHTFGHPVKIEQISMICKKYHLELIEDSAESIGTFYNGKHTGTFANIGIISFNGNKTITTGGGGMLLLQNKELADKAYHLSTQAKIFQNWEYFHDEIGYNYRMPNLNAALGCAQMENIDFIIKNKRETAKLYNNFCKEKGLEFVLEPQDSLSNYWLNAIILENKNERDSFLKYTNNNGVMTRPVWMLSNKLPMFDGNQTDGLSLSGDLESRIVNIPSGIRINPCI